MHNFLKKFLKITKVFAILFCFQLSNHVNSISECILVHFNNEIITKFDLFGRLDLIAFFNNIKPQDLKENSELKDSILKTLVEEKILFEKAYSLKLIPKQDEIYQFTKNFFLNSGLKFNDQDEIKKFLSENNLSYEVFEKFILNEIIVGKLIDYYKDEINQSKENEKFFKILNKNQEKHEYIKYNIIEFAFLKDSGESEKIKQFQKVQTCSELKENLKKEEINFDDHILEVEMMNQDLLDQIKIQGMERNIGFIPFSKPKQEISKDKEEEIFKEELGFIAFCPHGEKKIIKNILSEDQIESLRYKGQIKKIISEIIDNGENRNYIKYNEKCNLD
jgi:hypothetical protein